MFVFGSSKLTQNTPKRRGLDVPFEGFEKNNIGPLYDPQFRENPPFLGPILAQLSAETA